MNLAFLGNIYSTLMYNDTFSGYSFSTEEKDDDGAIIVNQNDTAIFTDEKCRVSFSQVDNPDSHTVSNNPIHHTIKIFCNPSILVKKGMRLVISHQGETYEGYANDPQRYESHLEIELVKKGAA